MNKEIYNLKNLSDKHLMLFLLMNEWVKAKQMNKSVESYLLSEGFRTIAVYGMSYAGQRLCDELIDSNVKIAYCIDQKNGGSYKGYEVIALNEMCKEVDAIVVTPVFYFEEIKKQINKILDAPVISLEEIIYGLTD